jgi:poly-gamma-glutamate capsule biosynthesis protein CapA/YwtB (metallophosphatase superfamily)
MRPWILATAVGLLGLTFAACGQVRARTSAPEAASSLATAVPSRPHAAIRLLFGGDVMLGRGVAPVAARDPASVFAGIRFAVSSADLAVANLESPLTLRPHIASFGPNALEAKPATVRLLVAAGFDDLGIANNHAGDAGPQTVPDTMRSLAAHGLGVIGAGSSVSAAFRPRIVKVGGLRVALLMFDATTQGPRAGATKPGVAWWDPIRARAAVRQARAEADIVAVGIHGGAEYVPEPDPYVVNIGRLLASWGVDVVWGTGPHVVHPVTVIDPNHDGRPTVVATSLGNLLFDQHIPGTQRGAILEVVAGRDGVQALRVGTTAIADGRVRLAGWPAPRGAAVALGDAWWMLARPVRSVAIEHLRAVRGFKDGIVVDAAIGDVEGDGRPDLAVSFRRRFMRTNVSPLIPRSKLVDKHGRSAHVGLYRPRGLRPRWVAGTLLRPVVRLAPCDGALAVAYSTLNDPAVVATGAWRWSGFGFTPLPDLPGHGIPGCKDIDGDGMLDPLILERSSR